MNSNAVSILSKKYIKKKPKRIASLALEREKSDIAQQIYDLRHQAGLTQKEFAKLVNTTPSVISRLESADYSGYSVNTLRRIAESMHHKLEIKFVPE
ncbi:MAG: hypothetical protein AMJ79_06010 [Phycisphaerae bacterium SM23_30]|nr:MAG: hypothetical protein AMJ79_06010 [Phycisphaerae bacterium SM23_30]